MKKSFLLFAVFAIVITTHAQISGGLKAGLNIAHFGGSHIGLDESIQPGFHLGGYMNIGLNEKLSFQPELLISRVGAKVETMNIDFTRTYKLMYLSVPLSIQYSFGNFNVHVGPQLSFLMRAKTEYNGSGEKDTKKYFRDCDLGLNFGAGINFGRLGVGARYSLGLIGISDPDVMVDDQESGNYKTNNVIQISAMYRLFGK